MSPTCPDRFTDTMQGILHTGVAAIRDQMRLGGIFNPMDDGMGVDPETGAIVGEGVGDSR